MVGKETRYKFLENVRRVEVSGTVIIFILSFYLLTLLIYLIS